MLTAGSAASTASGRGRRRGLRHGAWRGRWGLADPLRHRGKTAPAVAAAHGDEHVFQPRGLETRGDLLAPDVFRNDRHRVSEDDERLLAVAEAPEEDHVVEVEEETPQRRQRG